MAEVAWDADGAADLMRDLADYRAELQAQHQHQLAVTRDLISALEARIDAFEATEEDARTVAEWASTVASPATLPRDAARRYLSGMASPTASRSQRELAAAVEKARADERKRFYDLIDERHDGAVRYGNATSAVRGELCEIARVVESWEAVKS